MSKQPSNNLSGGGTHSTTTNTTAPSSSGGNNNRRGPGRGAGTGKEIRGKGKKPGGSTTTMATIKPKFIRTCNKDLEGMVIIHNPRKQVMPKQFIFNLIG